MCLKIQLVILYIPVVFVIFLLILRLVGCTLLLRTTEIRTSFKQKMKGSKPSYSFSSNVLSQLRRTTSTKMQSTLPLLEKTSTTPTCVQARPHNANPFICGVLEGNTREAITRAYQHRLYNIGHRYNRHWYPQPLQPTKNYKTN